jgi:oligosaccharide repeat unit polymerase
MAMDSLIGNPSRLAITNCWRLLLLGMSLAVLLISAAQIALDENPDRYWAFPVAITCLVWLTTFFVAGTRHFGTPYLFTTAYVLCLSVFHLGITMPFGLDLLDAVYWQQAGQSLWLERAGWSTVLALGSIGCGFALALRSTGPFIASADVKLRLVRISRSIVFWDGLGLLAASLVFFALAIYSMGNLLNYSRADLYRGVGDSRGLGVFMMVFPSAASLLVIGSESWWQKILGFSMAVLAFLLFMLSGYRSAALFPLLVAVIVWRKTERKVPVWMAVVGISLILLAIPMIGALRSVGPYGKLDKRAIETSVESAKVENTFGELGQTAGILANVLRLVPERDPHRYGMTYLMAVLQTIPNIMPDTAANRREVAKRESMKDTAVIANMIPSDWLTYRIAPEKYNIGQGVGFSAIAEAYLNFSYLGIFVYFLILGFVLGKFDNVQLLNHPNLIVFAGAMLWPLMRTVRNDFDNFLKPAAFMLIILMIWRLATHFVRPRGG